MKLSISSCFLESAFEESSGNLIKVGDFDYLPRVVRGSLSVIRLPMGKQSFGIDRLQDWFYL